MLDSSASTAASADGTASFAKDSSAGHSLQQASEQRQPTQRDHTHSPRSGLSSEESNASPSAASKQAGTVEWAAAMKQQLSAASSRVASRIQSLKGLGHNPMGSKRQTQGQDTLEAAVAQGTAFRDRALDTPTGKGQKSGQESLEEAVTQGTAFRDHAMDATMSQGNNARQESLEEAVARGTAFRNRATDAATTGESTAAEAAAAAVDSLADLNPQAGHLKFPWQIQMTERILCNDTCHKAVSPPLLGNFNCSTLEAS